MANILLWLSDRSELILSEEKAPRTGLAFSGLCKQEKNPRRN
jgi:hypothetical protein